MYFKKNDVINVNGEDVKILDILGDGGQGEVYLASYKNKSYALKLYKEEVSEDFKYNLSNNIKKGSPASTFLWPLELLSLDDGRCGYLMQIRPNGYETFISYLNGNTKFKDQRTIISWCIELCMSFKRLHEAGFSYQDLNDGSFFFKPDTGELLICDNDNVTADKKNLGILGKMRYMAPEIVRGDKMSDGSPQIPDIHTDRFSLAIILFMALCLGNPFEGERLKNYNFVDENAEHEMFGTNPIFIYHNKDKSNRPIRGYHTSVIKRWPYLPSYIQDAFHKTFVDGLADRENSRVNELQWIKLLTRYRSELISCSCGKQYIYGFKERKANIKCPYCGMVHPRIPVLSLKREKVVLELGSSIYLNHVDKYSSEYNTKAGVVIQNKKNPSLWGIKMNINSDIKLIDSYGTEKVKPGNGVIPLVEGLGIYINDEKIGEIE